MEIGIVVHGPGIIDSGYALKIIDLLSNYGNVHCRLGGTMGRTAVIDAALEDKIDISLKLLPSESLELFNRANYDVIFLLNYGKSSLTGQVFGYKTFTHYFKKISNEDFLATNHKPLYDSKIPVIQIERPGEEDGSIISWNVVLNKQLEKENKNNGRLIFKKDMVNALTFDFEDLFYGVANALDLKKVDPEEVVSMYFSSNIEKNDESYIKKMISSLDYYDESRNYTYRKIHGASPGENIFLNGIVVGYAHSEDIILIAEDGILVEIDGGEIKHHGVEKLGVVNLNNVIVKTGLLRKSDDVTPRILEKEAVYVEDSERNALAEGDEDETSFKVGFVDHAAYDIYRFKNFDLVVAIGDDTSLVASDILYRFNIPIIGITDGDLDKVVEKGFVNEKSTILEVASGFDDIVGHNIFEEIFESNQILEVPFTDEYDSLEEFKQLMLNIVKAHILDSVKEVVPTFIEKDYNFNEINSYSNLNQDINDLNDDFDSVVEELVVEDDGFDSVVEDLAVEGTLANEPIADEKIEEIKEIEVISEDLDSNNGSVASSDSDENSIEDNSEDDSDEEKSFAELVEEISASYEEDSDDADISEDADDQIIEIKSDSESFDEDVVYVESDSESFDEDVVFVESDSESFDEDVVFVEFDSESFDDDIIYVESGDEGIIEEEIVYVDEDGNEIVFEEGVVYVDSEGNEITFDNENGVKTISDDDFVDLDEETFESDPEELEKYNNILGEYVDGYEESLDEEFSKVYKESDDSENGEES